MLMQIKLDMDAVPEVLKSISLLVTIDQVELFEPKNLPKQKKDEDQEFESTAQYVANMIRPTPRQTMRRDALRAALLGWDTLMDQEGEPDPSLRNALGALSKAMRPVFPFEASPIDRLATRSKRFDDSGHYLATVYTPTKLGNRVKEILKGENAF